MYPVEGEINQTILGFTQDEFVAVAPPVDESVKHTWVFIQTLSWGNIKFATGGSETRIGITDPKDTSQGLDALIVAENEFCWPLLVTPQEDFKNVWVILAGGGWLKVVGTEPSLNVTV